MKICLPKWSVVVGVFFLATLPAIFLRNILVGIVDNPVPSDFLRLPDLLRFGILWDLFNEARIPDLNQSTGDGKTVFVVNDKTLNATAWVTELRKHSDLLKEWLQSLILEGSLKREVIQQRYKERFSEELKDEDIVCIIKTRYGVIVVLRKLPLLKRIAVELKLPSAILRS